MFHLLTRKWQIFGITYTTYAVVYITRKVYSIVKTLIKDDLNLSAYSLGSIDSAFLFTYAVFQVFLPALSDAYGVRPVLIIALSSSALFALLFSIGTAAPTLIIAWSLEGIGHASLFAVLVKSVSLWFPIDDRGTILGFWTTSQQVGAIIATSLTTYISSNYGWRPAFIAAAFITAAAALLVCLCLPEPPSVAFAPLYPQEALELTILPAPKRRRRTPASRGSDEESSLSVASITQEKAVLVQETEGRSPDDLEGNNTKSSNEGEKNLASANMHTEFATPPTSASLASCVTEIPMKFIDVIRIPGLLYCAAAYFCIKIVRYGLLFWLPFFLATELKFSATLAGYSSMLFDVGGIAGAVVSGIFAKKCFKGDKLAAAATMCIGSAVALLLFAYTTMSTSSSYINIFSAQIPPQATQHSVPNPENFSHILILMTAIGLLIAGPDSVLGAAAAGDMCEKSSLPGAQLALSTATGIVNGIGSLGGVAQGFVTAGITEVFGWSTLFVIFGMTALAGALFLVPVIIFQEPLHDTLKRSHE